MTGEGASDGTGAGASGVVAAASTHGHFDASLLRLDAWNRVQYHANWLRDAGPEHAGAALPRQIIREALETLRRLEPYWAFPGVETLDELWRLQEAGRHDELHRRVTRVVRMLMGEAYRARTLRGTDLAADETDPDGRSALPRRDRKPYFEFLVVDGSDPAEQSGFARALSDMRGPEDEFLYDLVFVPSFEDAVIGVLFNHTVQSVLLRFTFGFSTANRHEVFTRYLDQLDAQRPDHAFGLERSLSLGRVLKALRPELDLFLATDAPTEDVAGRFGDHFRRVFYRGDNFRELHHSILKGIRSRYQTPFFDALRKFSQKPTGVFHALPISRGKSINQSHWVRDLEHFYGPNLFLAETSATSGGLDSLSQPHGPIKRAQELAARCFGADRTYFVTNGTSTANKIVVQGLCRPGDIVLTARDCHKSHHYALMLTGAMPLYLDPYPLPQYAMFGGVPLSQIKRRLLELRRAGRLDRARMLLLTNCTFDGITYNPWRVMREVLAIKPDMIFLWDEAWFAFARFNPTLRARTAMEAGERLRAELASPAYRREHEAWKRRFQGLDASADSTWLDNELMPDPDLAEVRVYATQSTHKTITALRQGSMIHVLDDEFEQEAVEPFEEAFMTHTSTSPNYQIIATLDAGRRQMELEGYELVQKAIAHAMSLRERVNEHPEIRRYFSILRPEHMIPEAYRPSGLTAYYDPREGWGRMEQAWRSDEFCLDPTRVSISIGRTGLDGDAFRHLLMDEHDIQINKTTRNSALFNTNIGTTRGDIAYLVDSLASVARSIDDRSGMESDDAARVRRSRVSSLETDLPPLPNFSRFHDAFLRCAEHAAPHAGRPDESWKATPEGDLRRAFFMAYDDAACEHLRIDGPVQAAMDAGRELVSATFVTPYPPGFPVLVPGQVITRDIVDFLRAVDVKEIHGYQPGFGLRIFTVAALEALAVERGEAPSQRSEHGDGPA